MRVFSSGTVTGDYDDPISVRVMFTDGSAVGSLQTVTLTTINDDTEVEADESFVAILQQPQVALGDTGNFVLGQRQSSTITIIDNDRESNRYVLLCIISDSVVEIII